MAIGTRQLQIITGIVFSSLGLSALFFAQGTMGLVGAAFLPLDPEVPSAAPTVRQGGRGQRVDATPILRRNIFDSETGDLTAVATTDTEPDPEPDQPIDPNAPLPDCQGGVRLVASLVNVRHPEWSFAAISASNQSALLYRRGMSVDGNEVLQIDSSAVVLRPSAGSPCKIAMFQPPSPEGPARPAVAAARPEPAERPARPTREGAISTEEMEQGITRNGDTNFTVSRSLVDKLLENQAELMRTARIIPHEENGRTVGVKLYGIRRNSLLGRLGLQNGDMLRTINGYDMTSPDMALEAYSRLRSANNLSVSIVRRGQAQTLEYGIQ